MAIKDMYGQIELTKLISRALQRIASGLGMKVKIEFVPASLDNR